MFTFTKNKIYVGLILFSPFFILSTQAKDKNTQLEIPSIQLKVEKYKLANGLTVLLHEDHRAPMISFHTWYKVGSKNEKPGVTGAAHMLEHMMFKGAKKFDGKQFDQLLHENGIVNNAFTSNDFTGFYQNLPSDKLEMMMEMEVDRMSSLALREKDLFTEKEVVKEERRWRVDNSPMGLLRELTMSTLYQSHPYRWPVIGTMEDISDYDVSKLRVFYENYYVPNNAVLVLAGDFDMEKTKALIQKYYGSLPKKEVLEPAPILETSITSPRNAVLKQKVQTENLNISFHGVSQGHADMYALDLLAEVLGGGASSRLYKKYILEEQNAIYAYAGHSSLKDNGIFSVAVQMKPGLQSHKIEAGLIREMQKIKSKKISEVELRRAKIQIMKSYVDGLQTLDAKARALASSEIITGSYDEFFMDLKKYQAVTVADLQKVAQKYLDLNKSVKVTLIPEELEGASK